MMSHVKQILTLPIILQSHVTLGSEICSLPWWVAKLPSDWLKWYHADFWFADHCHDGLETGFWLVKMKSCLLLISWPLMGWQTGFWLAEVKSCRLLIGKLLPWWVGKLAFDWLMWNHTDFWLADHCHDGLDKRKSLQSWWTMLIKQWKQ